MIDGLKLTMTGEQLIERLNQRIRVHQTSIAGNETRLRQAERGEDAATLPARILQRAIAQSTDRIETLSLIRDHILEEEVYRLGEYDLRFADLLPEEDWFDCGALREAESEEGDLNRALTT